MGAVRDTALLSPCRIWTVSDQRATAHTLSHHMIGTSVFSGLQRFLLIFFFSLLATSPQKTQVAGGSLRNPQCGSSA